MMAELMDNVVMQLITIVLAVSTLLGILDYVGFLPAKLKNWLKMNRSQDSLDILNRLGVDVDRLRRANQSVSFPKTLSETDIKQTVQQALDTTCRINHEVTVGHMRKTALTHYYDLIGKVCNPECASDFAGVLSTFWATQCQNPDVIRNVDFDFVVTPKSGCPLLGYEFASWLKSRSCSASRKRGLKDTAILEVFSIVPKFLRKEVWRLLWMTARLAETCCVIP